MNILLFLILGAVALLASFYMSDMIADAYAEYKRKRGYARYRSNHNDKKEGE